MGNFYRLIEISGNLPRLVPSVAPIKRIMGTVQFPVSAGTDKDDDMRYTEDKKGRHFKTMTNNMLEATYNALLANKDASIADLAIESLEALMRLEREHFLTEEAARESLNKGNGFYERFVNALNHRMRVDVPRDRRGHFKPFALEIMKKESELLDSFALKLYSRGLSARDISGLLTEIYGLHYSPAKISRLVKEFEPYRIAWQERPRALRAVALLRYLYMRI